MTKGRITFEEAASEAQFGYVKGECKWAKVLDPDDYDNFSISMYGDSVIELEEELLAMQKSANKEVEDLGKKTMLADVIKVDNDGGKFIGFKLASKNFDGENNSIKMYDAGGNLVEDWDKLVGNGSTVKIKYRIAPYYMSSTKMVGISFKFYACQVINLVEFKAQDSGFGDETSEDGGITEGNNEDF